MTSFQDDDIDTRSESDDEGGSEMPSDSDDMDSTDQDSDDADSDSSDTDADSTDPS
jgi:hypothetical protein